MARITVRLTPRAGRDAIDSWRDDVLLIRVAAAASDGNANTSLLRLLAKRLRIAPSKITLVAGAQSRTKILAIDELALDEIQQRLKPTTDN